MSKFKVGDRVALIIDAKDFDFKIFKWHQTSQLGIKKYLKRTAKIILEDGRIKRKDVYLHRLIAERKIKRPLTRSDIVDHVNNNFLDNRRKNLRITNKSINALNMVKKSKHRGVSFNKKSGLYAAKIRVEGVNKSLGYFKNKEDAAKVYSSFLIKILKDAKCLSVRECK